MKRYLSVILSLACVLCACDKVHLESENPFPEESISPDGRKPLAFASDEYVAEDGFTAVRATDNMGAIIPEGELEPLCVVYEDDYETSETPMRLEMTSVERRGLTAEEVAEKYGTRAAPVTNFVSSYGSRGFGLFTYVFPATESWNPKKHTSEYMHNIAARYNSATGVWSANNITETGPYNWYFWPGHQYKIRFYAYAPYRGDDRLNGISPYTNMQISDTPFTGAPTITYGIPAAIRNHFDFCIAKTEDIAGDNDKTQPLIFKHAMTAVQITIGNNIAADVITKIEFVAMWRTGTINLETQEWTIARNYSDNATNFELIKNITVTGTAGQIVNPGTDTFIMMPTKTYEAARMEITFQNLGTKSFDIGNHVWQPGHLVTYTLKN